MADYLAALFPEPETRELVAIIGSSVGEVRAFRGEVQAQADRVRGMLGDFGRLEQAAALWEAHPLGHLGAAQVLLGDAGSDLAAHWSGPAHQAYQTHHDAVLASAGETEQRVREVAAAVRQVRDEVAEQYRAAIRALATLTSGIIGLAAGRGRIGPGGRDRALALVGAFIDEVTQCLQRMVDTLVAHADLVAGIRDALARLRVPAPTEAVAEALGDPARWELR